MRRGGSGDGDGRDEKRQRCENARSLHEMMQRRRGGDDGTLRRQEYNELEDFSNRLNSLIIHIGDRSGPMAPNVESNIDALANALEADLGKHKDQILKMMLRCVTELPTKTPVYGTLAGLLNVKNMDFGADLVSLLGEQLQAALDGGDSLKVKMLVRFAGELVNANVMAPVNFMGLLDRFIDAASESLGGGGARAQERADFFVLVALGALPWVGRQLAEGRPSDLQRQLSNIESYIGKRSRAMNDVVSPFGEGSGAREDFLESLWQQVVKMKERDWSVPCISRPYLAFEGRLSLGSQHLLPAISLPAHSSKLTYPVSRSVFRLFDAAEAEKEIKPGERFVIEEYVIDLLYWFVASPKEGTKQILSIPTSARIELLVVETIFGQLLKLPAQAFKSVYYQAMLVSLCRTSPATYPAAVARAMDALLERCGSMDVECLDRVTEYLAYHLSHFEFKWHWSRWQAQLDATKVNTPQYAFGQEVLERALRLSYYDRLRDTVPAELHHLLPAKPAPGNKYGEGQERHDEAKALEAKMREKVPADELKAWVENEWAPLLSPVERVDIVLHAVLTLGSKSFSHLLAVLERYVSLLRALISTPTSRMLAVAGVFEFWDKSPQHVLIVVDKMMSYRIVDAAAITSFIFGTTGRQLFRRSFVWDVLRGTVHKTLARVRTLKVELASAEKARREGLYDPDDEKSPEAERVRQVQAAIANAEKDVHELFLSVLRHFVDALTAHLGSLPPGTDPAHDPDAARGLWYYRTSGHLREFLRRYYLSLKSDVTADAATIFSANVDKRITQIYTEVASIFTKDTMYT